MSDPSQSRRPRPHGPNTPSPGHRPDGGRATGRRAAGSRPPRRGRVSRRTGRPFTRRQLIWRRIRRTCYALVALGMIGPIVAFMVAYIVVDVPDPADIETNQVATVFYDDGTSTLSTIVPEEGNRTDVTIDEIPEQVRFAVLAAEDRTFYSNPGFSATGIARAAVNNVTGGDTQGGSTITQQYVKNALTGNDQTAKRKLKELVISTKMSREVAKDDILTAYLNTIYFGRGAYGVAAASEAYFAKPVGEITVPEAAVLASVIRSPSAYDPETDPQAAQDRWALVLDGMVSQDWISAADRAPLTFPEVAPKAAPESGSTADGPANLIVRKVTDELGAAGITESELNTDGLQIVTTINQRAQQASETAVAETLDGQPENLAPASVSVDPRSGAVRAYYGNSQGSGFDFADSWGIQPGSSFKVFSLAAGLKEGIPLSQTYDGSSPQTIGGTEVANSDGENCGQCDLAEALKLSINTIYYQLTNDVGPAKVAEIVHAAGVPTEYTDGNGQTLKTLVESDSGITADGIALGQYTVPVLNMAQAYGALANDGRKHDPFFVEKVTTADGRVLLDRSTPEGATPSSQAIDPPIAQNVIAAMEPIAAASRDHGLADGRESAAKTGTAQLADTGKNAASWMIGCTPSLCTASVVTTTDQTSAETSEGNLVYGSGLPSDIWKATMDGALEGTEPESFPDAPPLNGGSGGIPAPAPEPAPEPEPEPQPEPEPAPEPQPQPQPEPEPEPTQEPAPPPSSEPPPVPLPEPLPPVPPDVEPPAPEPPTAPTVPTVVVPPDQPRPPGPPTEVPPGDQ